MHRKEIVACHKQDRPEGHVLHCTRYGKDAVCSVFGQVHAELWKLRNCGMIYSFKKKK